MKEFVNKLIGRLEECEERYDDVSFAQLSEFGITLDYKYAEGKRDGVAETIKIVNELAEEYQSRVMIDNEYCWQKCSAVEHCKECSRLGNGTIDYFENYDSLAEEYNNDVCEWERYEEKRIFFKHCTYRNEDIDEFSISKFKFCPYCGKKIKVVK